MTKKERMDLVLSKIGEDRKESFVSDIRKEDSREERRKVFAKYGINLTKDEQECFL